MKYYISPPPVSPLARVLGSIFAVVLFAGAIVFGLFVLAAAVGLGLLFWIGMAIRGWWLRRKGPGTPRRRRGDKAQTIEAEYTVISRRRD